MIDMASKINQYCWKRTLLSKRKHRKRHKSMKMLKDIITSLFLISFDVNIHTKKQSPNISLKKSMVFENHNFFMGSVVTLGIFT